MIYEPLWESAENIVQELGDEIKRNGTNIRLRESILGWQYGGRVFESSMKRLTDDMMTTKGYKVSHAQKSFLECCLLLNNCRLLSARRSTSANLRGSEIQQTVISYYQ